MGVYIKGMEMPPSCGFCKLAWCCKAGVGEETNLYRRNSSRHPDCPLIEVTEPHGRLIDEAEVRVIMHQVCARSKRTYEATECAIRNMKAVIEAEGE